MSFDATDDGPAASGYGRAALAALAAGAFNGVAAYLEWQTGDGPAVADGNLRLPTLLRLGGRGAADRRAARLAGAGRRMDRRRHGRAEFGRPGRDVLLRRRLARDRPRPRGRSRAGRRREARLVGRRHRPVGAGGAFDVRGSGRQRHVAVLPDLGRRALRRAGMARPAQDAHRGEPRPNARGGRGADGHRLFRLVRGESAAGRRAGRAGREDARPPVHRPGTGRAVRGRVGGRRDRGGGRQRPAARRQPGRAGGATDVPARQPGGDRGRIAADGADVLGRQAGRQRRVLRPASSDAPGERRALRPRRPCVAAGTERPPLARSPSRNPPCDPLRPS